MKKGRVSEEAEIDRDHGERDDAQGLAATGLREPGLPPDGAGLSGLRTRDERKLQPIRGKGRGYEMFPVRRSLPGDPLNA